MDSEDNYYLAFSVFPGIGPARFKLLVEYFGSAKNAWLASEKDLVSTGLSGRLIEKLLDFRKKFSPDDYVKKLKSLHIGFVTVKNPRYPRLLAQISDPPLVLFVRGKRLGTPINLERTIAVVGTRKMTPYGRQVTEKIVSGLSGYGFTIVSGMAYGVDAVAHQTAINCGGKTIAVLGCGVDIIAPPSNEKLYHQIWQEGGGAIMSEMPPALRPGKGLFPARNRIISGLCLGTVVVEGTGTSGALITARYASEQGREVFAVPGPITSNYSRAAAILIKNGAVLIESADDIMDELNISRVHIPTDKRHTKQIVQKLDDAGQRQIITLLTSRDMDFNDLSRQTGIKPSDTGAILTMLEMKGLVKKNAEGRYYIR